MATYASNQGSGIRSRPNATRSNATNNSSTNNNNTSYADSYYGNPDEQEQPTDGFFRRCWLGCCGSFRQCANDSGGLCGCYIREESRPQWLTQFYNFTKRAAVWIVLNVLFSLFLLFGPAIQSLVDTGITGDVVFLWLRVVMLCFFTIDIVIRCLAEEGYFVISLCGRNNSPSNSTRSNPASDSKDPKQFAIGSFLFWCDFVSTLSILYDLSWINNHHFDPIDLEIVVIEGIPNRELSHRISAHSLELNVIVDILRTARVARFALSHFSFVTINRFNLYGASNRLRSYMHHWRSKRESLETRSYAETQAITVDESVVTDNSKSRSLPVPSVLTTIQTDTVPLHAKSQFGESLYKKVKSSLPKSNKQLLESRQIEAAIKIQRLWRSRTLFESDDEWEVPADPVQSSPSFAFSKSFRMKSIFASFSSERGLNKDKSNKNATKSILERFAEENPDMLDESGAMSGAMSGAIAPRSVLKSLAEEDPDMAEEKNAPKSILDAFAEDNPSMVEKTAAPKSILDAFAEENPDMVEKTTEVATKSRFQSRAGKAHDESQVGSDMRQLTGKHVAIGTLLILLFTVFFTFTESSTTEIKTMVVLHTQTRDSDYINRSLSAAISSSVPTLYEYHPAVDTKTYFPNPNFSGDITNRNIVNISVTDVNDETSFGLFDNSKSIKSEAIVDVMATLFIVLFWFAGVVSFSGPVKMLVITPVEQMVRLLGMLTRDPLGYQSSLSYKQFLRDEDALSKDTGWSKDVLKGMETSFLKSTILRIGSLMKIGFGAAGVEIIQNNLKTGQNKNMLTLNAKGTPVSCIFLFCDIRQFTDATEQLQEEVFVFTNQIADVVHSICNSYGGAANKNVGDAFLVSWSLDQKGRNAENSPLRAKNNQADKALLSVVRICIALAYDKFFLEPLSSAAIGRLKTKLQDRPGSVVQMGFGLHAGTAVQGAIGSQRKIDAAYVAESADRSEFLESSTKKYGLKMLMSGEFHKLLHKRTRDRCRKIDQLLMVGLGDDDFEDDYIMDVFTYDMDIDALLQPSAFHSANGGDNDDLPIFGKDGRNRKQTVRKRRGIPTIPKPSAFVRAHTRGSIAGRKDVPQPSSITRAHTVSGASSMARANTVGSTTDQPEIPKPRSIVRSYTSAGSTSKRSESDSASRSRLSSTSSFPDAVQSIVNKQPSELVLPKGPVLYSHKVWMSSEMKIIRQKYVREKWFFEKFKLGLRAFYRKEWIDAKKYFGDILEHFDDGPSKYFLKQIDKNNGTPPEDFKSYGIVN